MISRCRAHDEHKYTDLYETLFSDKRTTVRNL